MAQRISQMTSAGALVGDELVELSKLSTTITKTATTISAQASDNSFNDSGAGLVAAGFTVGKAVSVDFPGSSANTIFSGVVTAVTTTKLTIGGADGDVIVDAAAGASVTITQWDTRRTTAADIAALVAAGSSAPLTYSIDTSSTADSDPGAGTLRFNNALLSAVTMLYIDNATALGITLTTYLASLAQTGFITLVQTDNPDNWRLYKITAVTSASGYYKLTVVHQAGNGSFADDVVVAVTFDSDAAGGGSGTQSIIIACSDEITALTTGTAKVTFRMPYGFTVTGVRASLATAQASGSIFTVDINESGSSILSTKLTIDNTEKTSATAATAAVVSDASLADDAEITIDIDQIGDGTAKGLKVTLIGTNP